MCKDAAALQEDTPPRLVRLVREGLRHLRDMGAVLKAADKNLGVVPIRKDIYNHLMHTHLKSKTFQKVVLFPHADISRRLRNILFSRKGRPDRQALEWIDFAAQAKDPCPFYVIPKLHKATLSSRPITAQHSYMLAPLSKKLAAVLQREVDLISEVAKDSKGVIQELEELKVQDPVVFLAYDVEQLYPSIDLKDAFSVLVKNVPALSALGGLWIKILKLIMYNNYVTANGEIYRQMNGTATGTQVAPPFANLYLHHRFKHALSHRGIKFQSRYIDDGLLFLESQEDAEEVMESLQNASNLKLTSTISAINAIYLDIEVYKGHRFRTQHKVDTRVYFKPTNRLLYLPAVSHHPQAHKSGVITGEAIRCLRNCSNKIEWLTALNIIFKGLMNRGYQPEMIKKKWKGVRWEDRKKYIFEERPPRKLKKTLAMTQYHPRTRDTWKQLIAKHPIDRLLLVKRNGRLNKKHHRLKDDWPPQLIYKEFKKLGRQMISAKQDTTGNSNSREPASSTRSATC